METTEFKESYDMREELLLKKKKRETDGNLLEIKEFERQEHTTLGGLFDLFKDSSCKH